MKNRMITAFLSAVILICAYGVCVSAEESNSHLWVGGEYVAPEKAADPFGDGTVSFDLDTNTLTLNNFKYEGYGTEWPYEDKTSAAAIIYDGERDFTLELKGENIVTQTGGADLGYGMFFNSIAVITGTGKLTVKGSSASAVSYAVYAVRELTVKGGEINASVAGASPRSAALCGSGVTVSGGVINAAGNDDEWSAGIYSAKDFVISGGVINAKGGKTNDYSAGIYSMENFTMTGGTVTAAGDTANRFSDGVYVGGDFAISGGTLTATGGDATEYSTGLYLTGDKVEINGGTVTLTGGDAGVNSCGINKAYTSNKDIKIGASITSLSLSGKGAATTGTINSAVDGVGYENADKTGEKSFITPDEAHDELDYKLIEFPHSHTLTKVEAKQPTNRESGNIEYYVCSGCGGYFRDADGKIYIEDKNSVIIPALGDEDAPTCSGFPWVWVVLAAVLICAAAVVIIIIVIKKKKQTEV